LSVIGAAGSAETAEPKGLYEFWSLDLNGEEVDQSLFAPYRLTMVNVWATYCPPCLHEMPILAELSETYAQQGVQIIGIVNDIDFSTQQALSQSVATARYIISETGADYTHLVPSEDLYNLRLKEVQVVPETFFVDSRGTIVGETVYGAKDKAGWIAIIDKTLALVDE
jgi:thiol-disulfide isomerase/thioredoxin